MFLDGCVCVRSLIPQLEGENKHLVEIGISEIPIYFKPFWVYRN